MTTTFGAAYAGREAVRYLLGAVGVPTDALLLLQMIRVEQALEAQLRPFLTLVMQADEAFGDDPDARNKNVAAAAAVEIEFECPTIDNARLESALDGMVGSDAAIVAHLVAVAPYVRG
jgi:hypothetical protein